ncbi:MAG: Peptidase M50 [uncultured Thermomicrobiales bacterium]|uniref:Peptidase M50 n=1 Tax=uncultured Thermomicrobiales bacterium TaxID=1645740 RepID=A0A6J4VAT9_9BACT|nr:MAG: Peptidase M50 [uncultured Thermomicrobiales bacterium]
MFGADLDPQSILARLLVFVIAITIHEFMHAFTAYRLGDPTAARLGRVTLNPVAHFDPFGFLFTILLILGLAPIAWGKPVPVNPGNFRNPKRGMLLVAAAGPLSNLVQAVLFAIPLRLLPGVASGWPPGVQTLLVTGVTLNIALAAFNMIPIPPLDGHKILTGLLPDFWYPILAPMEQYGFAILLLFLFLPNIIGVNIFAAISLPLQVLLFGYLVPDLF